MWGNDSFEVRLDVDELILHLQRFDANSRTLPMDAFAALVIGEVDLVIESEGAEGTDGRWEPFSEETLRRHPRRVGGMLLQDTGATAVIQVKEVSEQTVVIASPTEYAEHHLQGTRNMPKRDFFALNFPRVLEELGEIALEEILK